MTFHYFWGLLEEAFRRGQLLSNRIAVDDLSLLLGEAFRWGQMLSNRVACDDFSLLRTVTLGSLPSGTAPKLGNRVTFDDFPITLGGYFGKPSVGDSCLVTGLPFDDVSLLRRIALGSLPLGTAAQ